MGPPHQGPHVWFKDVRTHSLPLDLEYAQMVVQIFYHMCVPIKKNGLFFFLSLWTPFSNPKMSLNWIQ